MLPLCVHTGSNKNYWEWPGEWSGEWSGEWPGEWSGEWPGEWSGEWPGDEVTEGVVTHEIHMWTCGHFFLFLRDHKPLYQRTR